jgi:hypothetical protein
MTNMMVMVSAVMLDRMATTLGVVEQVSLGCCFRDHGLFRLCPHRHDHRPRENLDNCLCKTNPTVLYFAQKTTFNCKYFIITGDSCEKFRPKRLTEKIAAMFFNF